MTDMNALYGRLAAAEQAGDAAALAALAWQMYGLLAATAAHLGGAAGPVPGLRDLTARQRRPSGQPTPPL
jgi:hypothetical protein